MPEAMGATVIARVWQTLLTLVPSPSGAVAVRHAPLLAAGTLGAASEPLSSIQYPTGMRAALLASANGFLEAFPPVGDPGSDFSGYPELGRLHDDVLAFVQLEPARQAEVLSCLNCITEHRVAFRLLPSLGGDHWSTAAGCAALYEAARCLVRVRPDDRQSRTVLGRLSQQDLNPRIGTAAAVQLGALSIRHDHDLEAAAAALAVADRRRVEIDRSTSVFAATLLESRYFRAIALLALKRRDFRTLAASLEATLAAAEELVAATPAHDPYLELVAKENHRLVVEVHAMAASGAGDASGFATWAGRLLDADPDDPYTWRYIAVYGARCGLVLEAALAMAGLTAIGGLGMQEAADAVRRAAPGRAPETGLAGVILDALERLVAPEPARAA